MRSHERYFTVNGMVQAANQTFVLTAAQLAQTTFTAARVRQSARDVYDGLAFSDVKAFNVNVTNNAPDGDALTFFYDNVPGLASGLFRFLSGLARDGADVAQLES